MARRRLTFNKNISIGRVVGKIAATIIALYVGGTIVNEVGAVMNNTESPFYQGLSLIGWTIGDYPTNGTDFMATCTWVSSSNHANYLGGTTSPGANCITAVSGSGILAVVGIIGIAAIVMEFVRFRL